MSRRKLAGFGLLLVAVPPALSVFLWTVLLPLARVTVRITPPPASASFAAQVGVDGLEARVRAALPDDAAVEHASSGHGSGWGSFVRKDLWPLRTVVVGSRTEHPSMTVTAEANADARAAWGPRLAAALRGDLRAWEPAVRFGPAAPQFPAGGDGAGENRAGAFSYTATREAGGPGDGLYEGTVRWSCEPIPDGAFFGFDRDRERRPAARLTLAVSENRRGPDPTD